ncbi:c-type cytochrome [Aurantiacibacter gilvus]|uniref:C-type cytochrome n=1 Tax=Aurantiacibacter gilvus TaxID=3139141 RepID=A0ABU9IEA3_9SPHN
MAERKPHETGMNSGGHTRLLLVLVVFFAALSAVWGVLFLFGSPATAPTGEAAGEAAAPAVTTASFTPPPMSSIPDGPLGDSIRRGEALFRETGIHASNYVGSGLTCSNCHLDGGRDPNSAPMWAAAAMFPEYRRKNDRINTMEDRILGCFIYSMNASASPAGVPPPAGHDIYRDLMSYFSFLATGAPTGVEMPERGFLDVADPAQEPDLLRGAQVYTEQCSLCHGENGAGVANPDGTYAYPPLWGDHSYNWGAGMARLSNAAGFVKANMPFGNGMSLTDQQAWDVAAYIDSQERPPDPRQQGTSIEATRAAHHASGDYYGQVINGDLLGDGLR